MAHTVCHMKLARHVLLGLFLLLAGGVPVVFAAEDITGTWQVTMDFNGNQMMATLTIAKKADGTLTGKWGSSDIANVKFEGDKLTFTRTIQFGGGEPFVQNFTGTLKDGKITGTMGNEQFSSNITAVRKKPMSPAVGQWDITYKPGNQEITARLIISQKSDGTLTGEWTKEPGQNVISNVKFQDGKLTLTRKTKADSAETESTFEGTVKGDELTGTLRSSTGTVQANGKRFGTALVGTWLLTSNAEQGPRTGTLTLTDNAPGSPHPVHVSGTGMDFAIGVPLGSSSSVTITAGETADYTVAVTPQGGFNQSVSLSCSGAPSAAACSVSSSSVTPDGTPTTTIG